MEKSSSSLSLNSTCSETAAKFLLECLQTPKHSELHKYVGKEEFTTILYRSSDDAAAVTITT